MNTNEHELHPEHIRNPEVSYEHRDLSARGVLLFLIVLAVAGVFIHLILWGMFRYLGQQITPQPPSAALVTPARTLPRGDPARAFPAPQLQPDPVADLNKFRDRQEEILNSYDFVDKNNGVVRIPIERAIQIIAQRGLPTRPPVQAAPGTLPGSPQPAANASSGQQGAPKR